MSSDSLGKTAKTYIVKKHKVILFGHIFHVEENEPIELESKYQFTHQRADGQVRSSGEFLRFMSSKLV
jgi:hypothetical protein